MKNLILLASVFGSFLSNAQTNVNIHFPPKVVGNDLVLGTTIQDPNGVSMSIDHFNYYISNVHLIHDGGQDLDLSDTVFLVTATDNTLELGMLNVTNIESIDFGVGVPQSINHEDISQYDQNNPLSFQTPSMHWGWTSGYTFLLLNGFGDSNNDGTPNELFQIHSLGDQNYKYVSMAVIPTVTPSLTTIVINCNLDEWMYGANPGDVGVYHGTTGVNAAIMSNVNDRPVFTLPGNAGSKDVTKSDGELNYAIEADAITFNWKNVSHVSQYRLIDISGKEIAQGSATEFHGTQSNYIDQSGSYFFYLLDANGSVIKHVQVIR